MHALKSLVLLSLVVVMFDASGTAFGSLKYAWFEDYSWQQRYFFLVSYLALIYGLLKSLGALISHVESSTAARRKKDSANA